MINRMKEHLKIAENLAHLLDSQFKVGKFSFGLDPLVNFIPGIGSVITTSLSFYIIWIGIQMKLPSDKIAQMVGNVVMDFLISLIPILGQILDFTFKANERNLRIIKEFAPEGITEGEIIS